MTSPDVTVVIPVWNVERYLPECLDSVVNQTIGPDRLEVIAIDDGSTDSSGAVLDEYAARIPQVTVIHEPNSGGPGRPRNVGLDHARGTYVFFLDADDYLGPEALERLVAMAERNASDIVLGRMVGVDGRIVPIRPFRRNLDRASLGRVYSSLSALKLFRRALIERVGLRFEEGLPGGEDGPFTAQAYLEAKVVSVVADYDCYYVRSRPGSQTRSGRPKDYVDHLHRVAARIELLARYRKPGRRRDRLMSRHIADVLRPFHGRWLALEPEERQRVFDLAAQLITRWHNDRIEAGLSPAEALRAYCLGHGLSAELADIVAFPARKAFRDPVIESGRVFARYPHFRDQAGIPDSCFEITRQIRLKQDIRRIGVVDEVLHISGEAYLNYLGGSTEIVLRRWPWGPELRFQTESVRTPHLRGREVDYRDAGFTVDIPLGTAQKGHRLLRGAWEISLVVGPDRVRREAKLRLAKPMRAELKRASRAGTATELYLPKRGRVRLRVGAMDPLTAWLERGEATLHRVRRWPRAVGQ